MMTHEDVREELYRLQQAENRNRPQLITPDIQDTKDYTFAPICPNGRIGDSGALLLAKNKADPSQQYLVKHFVFHQAANEFLYSKLAQAMGYCIPDAVMFHPSSEGNRAIFKTDHIVGSTYLGTVRDKLSFEEIREQASNWQDCFHFLALENLFLDADGVEMALAADGKLYRIDTADAFNINEFHILQAADIPLFSFTSRKEFERTRLNCDLQQYLNFDSLDLNLAKCTSWDISGRKLYLETFECVQDIRSDYVDDVLNIICHFYPEVFAQYYKRFITTVQTVANKYRKTKG